MSSNTSLQHEDFIDKPGGPMAKNKLEWPKYRWPKFRALYFHLAVSLTLLFVILLSCTPVPSYANERSFTVPSVKKIDLKIRDHILYLYLIYTQADDVTNFSQAEIYKADSYCRSGLPNDLRVRAFAKHISRDKGVGVVCTYLPWAYPEHVLESFCRVLGGTKEYVSKDYILNCRLTLDSYKGKQGV